MLKTGTVGTVNPKYITKLLQAHPMENYLVNTSSGPTTFFAMSDFKAESQTRHFNRTVSGQVHAENTAKKKKKLL